MESPEEGTPPPEKRRRRIQLGLIELLLLMNILGCLLAIVVPRIAGARQRANTRSCYANPKTIAGALEMYNLDNMTIAGVEPAVLRVLQSAGYLQELPEDPGMGPGTLANYSATSGGNGITCATHGPIQDEVTP